MRIYFAGPLFTPDERVFIDECAARLRAEGIEVFVPHENALALPDTRPATIFAKDWAGLSTADGAVGLPPPPQGLDGALDSGRRRRAPRRPDGRRRNGLRNRDLLCADAERPDEEGNRRAAHGPAQHAGPRGSRAEPLRARLCRGGREDLLDARRGRRNARGMARLAAFVPPRTYS